MHLSTLNSDRKGIDYVGFMIKDLDFTLLNQGRDRLNRKFLMLIERLVFPFLIYVKVSTDGTK